MAKFIKKSLACCLALVLCLTCMLSSLTFSAETIDGYFEVENVSVAPGSETADVKVAVHAPGANEILLKVTTSAGAVTAVKSDVGTSEVNTDSGIIAISTGFNLENFQTVNLTVTVALIDTSLNIEGYDFTVSLLSASSRYEEKFIIPDKSSKIFITEPIVYTYEPNSIDIYRTVTTNSDGSLNYKEWETSGTVKDSDIIAIAPGGVNDSYALVYTGEGVARQTALKIAVNALKADTTYTVSFDARVSEANALKHLSLGLMTRWERAKGKTAVSFTPDNDEGISKITTEWKTFTGTCVPDSTFADAAGGQQWHYVFVNYELPANTVLYIDNISIKAPDGEELFWQGAFDVATQSYTVINENPDDAYLTAKYNEIEAKVIAINPAISGNNVLALGFKDTEVNNRIWFGTTFVRPRETYKLEMWVMVVGDVSSFKVTMGDNDPYANGTTVTDEMQAANPPESTTIFNWTGNAQKYLPRTWVKIERIWTDPTTATGNYRWAGLNISAKAPAGSGVLIDSISITALHEGFEGNSPNLFNNAGFENDYSHPDVVWNDKFTTNGNLMDLSFMNDLPKTVGALCNDLESNYDNYFDYNTNPAFSYMNAEFVAPVNVEQTIFETQAALKAGREVWLSATYLVCKDDTLVPEWEKKLDQMAYIMESIAGDKFQGVYFDEPGFHFANNEEFIAVTKYVRENYKKRVFSMCNSGMFRDNYNLPLEDDDPSNDSQATIRVYVSAESHKYVTDIGYWAYTPNSAKDRAPKFDTYCAKLDSNVRKWICALMGKYNAVTTEDKNIEIFNTMVNGAKDNNNFGGIVLWDTYSTHGYECLKPDETGVAPYDEFRNLLAAASKDFESKDSWLSDCGRVTSDNVVVLNNTVMSDDFINSFSPVLQSKLTFLYGGEVSTTPRQLVNNSSATIKVASITTTTDSTYTFALANDVNCDNKVSASDLVRAKRIVAEDVAGNKLSFAAAGTDTATGMSVSNIAAIRAELLK